MAAVAIALRSSSASLEELVLRGNGIGLDGIKTLSAGFVPGSKLLQLHLDSNAIGDLGVEVYKNFTTFCKSKRKEQQVLDALSPPELNKHLQNIMPGLTAKVPPVLPSFHPFVPFIALPALPCGPSLRPGPSFAATETLAPHVRAPLR